MPSFFAQDLMMSNFPPDGFGASMEGRLHGARTVMANGPLDATRAGRVTQELLALAASSDDDVRLLFAMHGDHLDPAFTVYDVVKTIRPRVKMIATGRVAGSGVVVFCASPLEDRTCLPMARFHLHAFRAPERGEASRLTGAAEEAVRQSNQARDIIAEATGLPPARIEEDLRRGTQLDAREAETYGLVARLSMRGEL
jgi:ATP-dependent Clp protease protease subunit